MVLSGDGDRSTHCLTLKVLKPTEIVMDGDGNPISSGTEYPDAYQKITVTTCLVREGNGRRKGDKVILEMFHR